MTITLTDDLEEIVRRHMASGRYSSATDVLAAALDLLDADTDADDCILVSTGGAQSSAGC